MPFTEWPYGGTNPLGATLPNAIDSPLMSALGNTSVGKWMNENHIQTYGWISVGANLSTNTVHGGNAPAAYDYVPNTIDMNQLVQYVERVADTVQKDHNDWGFRFSAIYGSDYRYTTSYGLGSYQLLGNNQGYGWDMPMLYVDWYTPFVGKGLNIRVGRYISVPDVEAQLAPNNYMYSHSMTYTFDNYTNEGILASLALDKNWILQGGVTIGTEATVTNWGQKINNPSPSPLYGKQVPFDPGARPSFTLCGRWNSDNGGDDVNFCANGINSGVWGYNNLQWYGVTAYHKFNDKWHVSWELYNEHQNNVPNGNNQNWSSGTWTTPFSSLNYNQPGMANCNGSSSVVSCTASSTGTVLYLNYSPNPMDNFSIRPEIYWDSQGQRTGTKAVYKNFALGWQHWFSPQLEVRPEIAYYHSSSPAFNGNMTCGAAPGCSNIAPNRTYQMILGGDIIFHW
jgi:hypothetical protein